MDLQSGLSIVGGLVLLVVGAEALVRGSVLLARRLRIGSLVIGLTVVAFGTSAPELVVSARAALSGNGGIAIGNVVGSNIANVLLILAIAACIRPLTVQSKVVRIDIPLMIVASLLVLPLLADSRVSRLEGAALLLGITAYTVVTVRLARREGAGAEAAPEPAAPPPAWPASLVGQLASIGFGLGMLVWGADLLVGGAIAIAGALGVSQAVIGLTVVALGTSLPELVTSVVAALRNASDIAVGNVVGSNIFNLLAILGSGAVLRPLDTSEIVAVDYLVMIAAAVFLLPMAWTGWRLSRWEALVLLSGYVAYVSFRAGAWG